jgi:hypothetical protein
VHDAFTCLARQCTSMQAATKATSRHGTCCRALCCVQDVARLKADLFALQQNPALSTASHEAGAATATALRLLERDTEMLKKKLTSGLLAALGADGAALAGAARQSDLLEVVAAVERKVERGELPKLLRKAVAMALDTYRAAAEASAVEMASQPGRALKSKCLSCDRDINMFRPLPLGPLPSAAGLLPNVERFPIGNRPATAAAAAAPPHGPGLNAAELRRQKAEEGGALQPWLGAASEGGDGGSPRPGAGAGSGRSAPVVGRHLSTASTASVSARRPVFS